MVDEPKIQIGGYAAIFETSHFGRVVSYTDDEVVITRQPDYEGRPIADSLSPWRVPRALVEAIEHPLVEKAADEILDILREYEPSWGVNPTINHRRRIVKRVLEVIGYDPDFMDCSDVSRTER